MKIPYFVKFSMRLDEIVYDYYGNLDMFEHTLEENSELSSFLILEAGTIVHLEEKQTKSQTTSEENLKSLW